MSANRENLADDLQASLERGLAQSAAGDTVSLGSFAPTTHVAHVPAAMIPTGTPVVDVMVTRYEDGAVEVAFRPGPGATWQTWGVPVEAVRS